MLRRWRYELSDYLKKCIQQGSCVVWTGSIDAAGYGRTSYKGKKGITAHRAVWLSAGRKIPKGLELDHACFVRACVAMGPEHVRLSTRTANIKNRKRPIGLACIHGHVKTDGVCRVCRYQRIKDWRSRHPEKARAIDRIQKRLQRTAPPELSAPA